MRILIVGSGGREHALAWKVAQSPRVRELFVAPGNAGTAALATNVPIAAEDVPALVAFARARQIDLTIVGPEAPLAAGLVDALQAAGLRAFGPSAAAAQLEASKAFAKAFMARHAIPTAAFATFNDYAQATGYVMTLPDAALVVKASGLAAGKGVIMCDNRSDALAALQLIMQDAAFGDAGAEVVIEERLTGVELSLIGLADGRTVVPLVPARDHKRVFDGDAGPNTGGMGAFAPPPDIAADFVAQVTRDVLQATVDGMAAEGTPYVGVLYAGLMLTPAGVRVLEFNCRLGDPETQVLLPLLAGDLIDAIEACLDGRLTAADVPLADGAAATIVLASEGYPGDYPKGVPITGIATAEQLPGVTVFHAGTALRGDTLVTSGGRVLAVTAVGATLERALERAYAGAAQIAFSGAHYRRDIGRPAQ